MSLEWSRVELLDDDDPFGTERANDHAIGWSLLILLVVAALVDELVPTMISLTTVAFAVAVVSSWVRAVSSGVWLSRSGLRAVSFPRQVTVQWSDADAELRTTPFGPRLRLAEHGGRTVTLSLNQLASGAVFAGSRRWRTSAIGLLAVRLRDLANELG
jgi:hypothetical protein